MAVTLGVDRLSCTQRGRQAVETAVHHCLGPHTVAWRVCASPSGALSGWWLVDLTTEADATHVQVFVDSRRNLQAQVCRRLAEAIPAQCRDVAACSPCAEASAFRIEIDASVPAVVAERFAAAARSVFERRAGVWRVRVAAGRSADEVALVVDVSRRRTPLPLYFPRASEVEPDEVVGTLSNVLEGLGPFFS